MILFLDMDNVLADFPASEKLKGCDPYRYNPPEMYEQFFFENLPPVRGALSGVRRLLQIEEIEIHILTQPVKETHYSYSEKVAWVAKWFPELLNRVTLTQKKELLSGRDRILLDDNDEKWKDVWEKEGGKFVHFNYRMNHKLEWSNVVDQIIAIVRKRHLEVVQ